ncbi:hypothetical protein AB0H82_26985 [Streptomyces sp. NPDC050732]|uniref:hypothetical protein n=1 Tax=Streptomyces sp. NPDC050732 TaxID=3154632 RepID=UPI003420DDFE
MPVALALVVAAPSAAPQEPPHARVGLDARAEKPRPRPFGSECRTAVVGSHAVAYCHNPYPETDRVRLHVECYRWWDIDTDSRPVEAGPAMTVRLTGRCWKEVRAVWVSHEK